MNHPLKTKKKTKKNFQDAATKATCSVNTNNKMSSISTFHCERQQLSTPTEGANLYKDLISLVRNPKIPLEM